MKLNWLESLIYILTDPNQAEPKVIFPAVRERYLADGVRTKQPIATGD